MDTLSALEKFTTDSDASVVIHRAPGRADGLAWSLMATFGEEEPGSPMAGGALHGMSETIEGAIKEGLGDVRRVAIGPSAVEITAALSFFLKRLREISHEISHGDDVSEGPWAALERLSVLDAGEDADGELTAAVIVLRHALSE